MQLLIWGNQLQQNQDGHFHWSRKKIKKHDSTNKQSINTLCIMHVYIIRASFFFFFFFDKLDNWIDLSSSVVRITAVALFLSTWLFCHQFVLVSRSLTRILSSGYPLASKGYCYLQLSMLWNFISSWWCCFNFSWRIWSRETFLL